MRPPLFLAGLRCLRLLPKTQPNLKTASEAASEAAVIDCGLPVLYVNIDEDAEGCGTIEEMNSSPDHSVNCTGTLTLDIPEGYTGDYSEEVLSDLIDLKIDYIRGRDRIVSYIGDALGMAYNPKMLPVDLVINGEYYGSYLLSEQIRVGKNRVDIDEPGPEDNAEPEVTGGCLLAMLGTAEEE